jgi:hypothetical protein
LVGLVLLRQLLQLILELARSVHLGQELLTKRCTVLTLAACQVEEVPTSLGHFAIVLCVELCLLVQKSLLLSLEPRYRHRLGIRHRTRFKPLPISLERVDSLSERRNLTDLRGVPRGQRRVVGTESVQLLLLQVIRCGRAFLPSDCSVQSCLGCADLFDCGC